MRARGVGRPELRGLEAERELGAVDREEVPPALADRELGRLGEDRGAVESVVIGEREAREPEAGGLARELLGR